jgi:antirestriction protein ArdC
MASSKRSATRTNRDGEAYVRVDDKVTQRIIEQLDAGTVPWEKPWMLGGEPVNGLTGKPYQGINPLLLAMTAFERKYRAPFWFTFKQASSVGGSVQKGEKGTTLVRWVEKGGRGKDEAAPAGDTPVEAGGARGGRRGMFPVAFTLFNAEQIKGSPWVEEGRVWEEFMSRLPDPTKGLEHHPHELGDRIITDSGAHVEYQGGQAMYVPALDVIVSPPKDQYKSQAGYYSTMFHELGHWTGHPSRLDRPLHGKFGTESYAREELVAELTAAKLCHRVGLDFESQSAAYIATWLRRLKEDKSELIGACSQSSKAADLLAPPRTYEILVADLQARVKGEAFTPDDETDLSIDSLEEMEATAVAAEAALERTRRSAMERLDEAVAADRATPAAPINEVEPTRQGGRTR